MGLSEFDLIDRFFRRPARDPSIRLGIGDDCALLTCGEAELAVTTDTLVEGVHFLPAVEPAALGYKALAVNLSDLAAMGAAPRWVTLALTLPAADSAWIAGFADGFFQLAERYGVALVGGDTTHGPLSITVQALGLVPPGGALKRSGAAPGDGVYVTGRLGDAGLGLRVLQEQLLCPDPACVQRLQRPSPRVESGLALRGIASACIDISDGLAADLGHLLDASGAGATLQWEALPLGDGVREFIAANREEWRLPLTAGDDYELCFTVPPAQEARCQQLLAALPGGLTRIGAIEAEPGLRLRGKNDARPLDRRGYEHFS